MSIMKIINATGLACPQPVVLAKQAIEAHEQVMVIVDNETALENVKRLGTKMGCLVKSQDKGNSIFEIILTRKAGTSISGQTSPVSCETPTLPPGPFVIVCAEDKMGRGSDELGYVLIRSFLHTITQQAEKPDTMIFYNTGVKLTLEGSEVIDDLKTLQAAGVEILVCGTCLNYFDVKDKLAVGVVSNMYDIAQVMSNARRLVNP